MALVKYAGPAPSADVPAENKSCLKGSSITVSAGVAASLLAEGNTWEAGDEETRELETIGPVTGKIVTDPISGTGAFEQSTLATQYIQRFPVCLPVASMRWRLRVRNYSVTLGVAGTAAIKILGGYFGAPKWNSGRWTGALAAAPTDLGFPEALLGSTLADYVSPWVTSSSQQFAPNVPNVLSLAFDKGVGKSYLDPYGSPIWAGAGAKAAAALAAAPTIGGLAYNNMLDVRIEYECASTHMIGLVIGDSITQGQANLEVETKKYSDFGCLHYESWPGALALRRRHPIINAGVGAFKTDDWATLANSCWKRLNLAISLPEYCVIAVGLNDILIAGRSAATIEANLSALVLKIQESLGIKSVYLATMTPVAFETAQEKVRTEVNTWMREIPDGVSGVIDFDKILSIPTEPSKMDTTWDGGNTSPTTGPHPWRAGYQKMAQAAELP